MTRLPNTRFHNLPLIAHGRRERTDGVVIHTIQGSDESAESWFARRNTDGVGAQLVVGTALNEAVQLTDLDSICWHAPGCNRTRIGIEHDGFAEDRRFQWLSSARRRELRMSANRTAWICYHYKLGQPTHGTNVIGHVDCPGSDHTDPGKEWPWTFYIWLARRAYKRLVATKGKRWS